MTRYVAVYCRISQDKRGRAEGVKSQEKWGREYATSAWPDLPVEVFSDNDISAMDPNVTRPEFERLREWIEDGRIAHVWCVEQYRYVRQEVEWFRTAAELDAAGITELHTNRDGIVRVQDEIAGIRAVIGAGEVRRTKKRIHDRLAEVAAEGIPSGGTRFGYRSIVRDDGVKTLELIRPEADVMCDAADKILAGWGLNAIEADIAKRGIRGRRGGTIRASHIRWWFQSPTIAGLRVHQGRIVGPGNWKPILHADPEKAENIRQAVLAKLAQPRRVRRTDGKEVEVTAAYFGQSTGRKYLLTGGITACGKCGAPATGQPKKFKGADRVPYLLCPPKARGGNSCVGIVMAPAEKYVVEKLFAELDKPEFLEQIASDDAQERRDEITTKLSALEGRRNDLAATWGAGELTVTEWHTARRAMAEAEQELRRTLAELPPPTLNVDIAAARGAWPHMTLDEQREFLTLFIEQVRILPSPRGRWATAEERVAIDWRKR